MIPLASTESPEAATLLPERFVIYPKNRPFVSGEIGFQAASRRKRCTGFGWLIVAVPIMLGAPLLFNLSPVSVNCFVNWFIVAILVALPLQNAVTDLYIARLYRQLSPGQFIDGEIVSSALYWAAKGRGEAFFLEVTYSFVTPTGDRLQRTVKTPRDDFWKRVQAQIEGIRWFEKRPACMEQFQAFAPSPGTPIQVRYVHDFLFRVM